MITNNVQTNDVYHSQKKKKDDSKKIAIGLRKYKY